MPGQFLFRGSCFPLPAVEQIVNKDLDARSEAFQLPIMIGEIGNHTTTTVLHGEKPGRFESQIDLICSKPYIKAVCVWVHTGSTAASIFENDSGTIRPSASNTREAIQRAFTTGNAAFGRRGRVV